MGSVSDHRTILIESGPTAGATRMAPKQSWRRSGLICPKQSVQTPIRSVDAFRRPRNWQVVYTYLLAEVGIQTMKMVNLEELAAEKIHIFAFFDECIKLRGATGSPMRPVAMPLAVWRLCIEARNFRESWRVIRWVCLRYVLARSRFDIRL
jgi:hypothetical protein